MKKSSLDFSLSYTDRQTKFKINFNVNCPTLIKEIGNLTFLEIDSLTSEEYIYNFTADGTSKSAVILNIYPYQTIIESVNLKVSVMITK